MWDLIVSVLIIAYLFTLMGGLFFSVSSVSFQALFISLQFYFKRITYLRMPVYYMVLRYEGIHAFDYNKTMKIIYIMYRAGEVSVHQACCERATQPYSLGRGGTIYPGSRPAGVTTRCPRMVRRVFTQSLDVN